MVLIGYMSPKYPWLFAALPHIWANELLRVDWKRMRYLTPQKCHF